MTDLIDFDLAKAQSGEYEVVYRSGESVLEWHCFKTITGWPIISSHNGNCIHYKLDGTCHRNEYDLMLRRKKRKLWIVVSDDGSNRSWGCSSGAYFNQEEAAHLLKRWNEQFSAQKHHLVEVEV